MTHRRLAQRAVEDELELLLRLIVVLLLLAKRCGDGEASARESRSVRGGDSMMPNARDTPTPCAARVEDELLLRLIVVLLLQAKRCGDGEASARESRSVRGGDSMMPRP
jgi:hypothetical protein